MSIEIEVELDGHAWININRRQWDGHFDPTRFSVEFDTEANPPYKLVPRENLDALQDARLGDGKIAEHAFNKWAAQKPSICYHGIPETPCDECKPGDAFCACGHLWSDHGYCGCHGTIGARPCGCSGFLQATASKPQVHVYTLSVQVIPPYTERIAIETGLFPGTSRLFQITKGTDETELVDAFLDKFHRAGYRAFRRVDVRVTKHSEVR